MKFNYFYKILGLSVLVLLLASCASTYKTVYIEVAKPSEYILPNDIVSLTLMNRGISNEFKNFSADSLQVYFYKQGFDVDAAVLDSAASDTTLKVLAELLFESGRYDVVVPENRNIPRDISYYRIPKPLDWDYVAEICDTYNTDALLVIERYMNKIMTDYMRYDGIYEATIDSKYDAIIKVYDPKRQEIIKQIMVDDTVYWYANDYSQKTLFTSKLVPVKQALIETGIQIALEFDKLLSPQWETQSRGYFELKEVNQAIINSSIRKNDWTLAYSHWKELAAQTDNKTTKSKLEYNLAIASEMLGNIEEAAQWATKSYKTQYRKQTENYLYTLKRRIKAIEEFKKFSSDS